MLIVKIREGETVDSALKRFKRKVNNIKLTKELRDRMEFKKSSVIRREKRQKAIYVQKKWQVEN